MLTNVRELRLGEIIKLRHEKYQDILKKELTMAKYIIKDPTMLKKAGTHMNFDRVDIYPFKEAQKEIAKPDPPKSKQYFESFNFNHEDFAQSTLRILIDLDSFSFRPNNKKTSHYENRSNSLQHSNAQNCSISPRSNFSSIARDHKIDFGQLKHKMIAPATFRKNLKVNFNTPATLNYTISSQKYCKSSMSKRANSVNSHNFL